jgi:hypothetical protein
MNKPTLGTRSASKLIVLSKDSVDGKSRKVLFSLGRNKFEVYSCINGVIDTMSFSNKNEAMSYYNTLF